MTQQNNAIQPSGGKIWIWLLIIVLLVIVGAAGWYFFLKKTPEGGVCTTTTKCATGLTCANKICSSGNTGSACERKDQCKNNNYCVNNKCSEGLRGDSCTAKIDCQTDYCVNGKCTEGKKNDTCITYKDCGIGLFCTKGLCTISPDYTKYFSKIVISKMKPGLPPGPNNPRTVTSNFKTTDAIEIDFYGVKPTTIGEFYFDIVNPITGEVAKTTKGLMEQKLNGQNRGAGTDLQIKTGQYDLNIYFKNELVYNTQITIS